VPVPDGSDNLGRVGTLEEDLGLLVILLDEAVDGKLEINDGVKDVI
jgi:hypothetical protein